MGYDFFFLFGGFLNLYFGVIGMLKSCFKSGAYMVVVVLFFLTKLYGKYFLFFNYFFAVHCRKAFELSIKDVLSTLLIVAEISSTSLLAGSFSLVLILQ